MERGTPAHDGTNLRENDGNRVPGTRLIRTDADSGPPTRQKTRGFLPGTMYTRCRDSRLRPWIVVASGFLNGCPGSGTVAPHKRHRAGDPREAAMSILDLVDNLFVDLFGNLLSDSLQERIRIESVEDERTLSLKDGSLVSIISIEGSKLQLSSPELAEAASRMRISLAPFLSDPGHAVKFTFARDPTSAERIAKGAAMHNRRQAKRLGLEVEDMFSDRERKLAECLVRETNLISVHTRQGKGGDPNWCDSPDWPDQRNHDSHLPGRSRNGVYARHVTFVEAL